MKTILFFLITSFITITAMGQNPSDRLSVPDSTKKIQIFDAACGICQLDMKGKDCELAVRINGRTYFVEGTGIDDHGDAHAKNGFCNAIRKAAVQGEIVNNHFKLSYFKLLTPEEVKELKGKTTL